jgi:hypothetical protein
VDMQAISPQGLTLAPRQRSKAAAGCASLISRNRLAERCPHAWARYSSVNGSSASAGSGTRKTSRVIETNA